MTFATDMLATAAAPVTDLVLAEPCPRCDAVRRGSVDYQRRRYRLVLPAGCTNIVRCGDRLKRELEIAPDMRPDEASLAQARGKLL